jgi:4-hydroxymandelate oxidase
MKKIAIGSRTAASDFSHEFDWQRSRILPDSRRVCASLLHSRAMSLTRRELLRTASAVAGSSLLATTSAAGAAAPSPLPMPTPVSPADLFDVSDFERAAQAAATPMAWDYISGAAADEITLRWNGEAYQKLQLKPRVLHDVSKLDTRVTLLGRELPFPILIAPTAYHKLFHPDGELATVRGAGAADATMVVSSSATVAIDEVAKAATKPIWFQLYVQPDRDFTAGMIRKAEAAGCEALAVTVDTPVLGPRYRELRAKFALPAGMERANLRGLAAATRTQRPTESNIFSLNLDPSLSWKDIEWIRSLTKLPVLLKGILNPDDADRAVQMGVAGLIVSNHGARNLDTVPATIDALPEVIARVGGRVPVLVDGGIRRGTDILKALALGATAVLIGRPAVYGLAAQGAAGVTRVVNILRGELEMAMALSGRPTIKSIDSSVIWK